MRRTFVKFAPAILALLSGTMAGAAETPLVPSCAAPKTLAAVQTCDGNVTAIAMRKDEIFLLSRKDAPAFEVRAVRAGKPLDRAVVLVPSHPGRTIESVHPALDAIYVLAREGTKAELLRVPVRSSGGAEIGFTQEFTYRCRNCRSFPAQRYNRVLDVPLPYDGIVSEAHSDPLAPGITITLENTARGEMILTYVPSLGRFINRTT